MSDLTMSTTTTSTTHHRLRVALAATAAAIVTVPVVGVVQVSLEGPPSTPTSAHHIKHV